MEYRQVGSTSLHVSAIGLGTWEIGNPGYGHTIEEEAIDAIHRALDLGVTCFDTAPVYGCGRAEIVLGRALGRHRRDIVLVTKCGLAWSGPDDAPQVRRDASRTRILTEIDDSLRHLETDWVDVYLVHWPDPATPIEETARAMAEVLQAGKTRAVGVSNFSLAQLQAFESICPVAVIQMGYNLFDRRIEADLLPYCRDRGIAIIAYGALCYGLLTGTFTTSTRFTPPDWRATGSAFGLSLFTTDNFPRNIAVVEKLKAVAGTRGKTTPKLALNWLINRPGVTLGLTGVRRPAEIEENVNAIGWQLSPNELRQIDDILTSAAGNTGPLPDW